MTVPAVVFLSRGRIEEARHFVLVVMITFVGCYLVFLFFPVAGPYYVFAHPPAWFIDNGPARLVYATLAAGSSYGAAFPSSHVAGAVAATVAASRGSRRLGLALVIPTLLLTLGVVYCQMHYGVDAVVGALAGMAIGIRSGERGTGKGERERTEMKPEAAASRSPVLCSPFTASRLYCTVSFPCMPSARCGGSRTCTRPSVRRQRKSCTRHPAR